MTIHGQSTIRILQEKIMAHIFHQNEKILQILIAILDQGNKMVTIFHPKMGLCNLNLA